MNVIGTVTIGETNITYSGFGNLSQSQKEIINNWAIERLRIYSEQNLHKTARKQVNQAFFPGYVATE